LVAIDRGKSVSEKETVDTGDFAVLRVDQLLGELSKQSNDSVEDVATYTDYAADMLSAHNRPVTRQQILEDICLACSRRDVVFTSDKRYKDVVYAWARKTYLS